MKKYLALILGVLFILGFAASAFAIHAEIPSETQAVIAKGQTQITLGGEIRVRGEYKQNVSDFDDDKGDNNAAYDQRVRLSLQADVTKNTRGFVHLESGGADNKDNVTWGAPTPGATGIYANGNAKKDDIRILEAWIQYSGSGLGFPAFAKIGHMPLALGNKLFFDHSKFGDDAILFAGDPMKELHVAVLTAKFREGSAILNDDSNAYVGLFAYTTKEFGVSGDATFVDDQTFSPEGLHFWNFGLRGNIMLAGLNLRADGELQTGKAENPAGDIDFKGWAFLAGIDYKMDPVKLTLEYAIGSGPETDPTEINAFVTSLGADQHFTYVYEYRTANACGNANGGICNTQYVKVGAAADLTKDLSAVVNGYWLQAVEDVSLKGGPADDDIGIEVDAKITYKLDRNLNYWVEGGYLFAGDAWNSATKDADDAYAIRHGIQLSF